MPAQKAFCGAAFDLHDFPGEQPLRALGLEHGLDRIEVAAVGLHHRLPEANALGGGAKNAPALHFRAAPRRLAGRRDRTELGADFPARPLHPFPIGRTGDDDLVAAGVDRGERCRGEIADRKTRHLRFGIGAAHGVRIDHQHPEMGGGHQRLIAVVAADFERHDGAKL